MAATVADISAVRFFESVALLATHLFSPRAAPLRQ